MQETSLLSQFIPLQTIVCCPLSRSDLSLVSTSDLAERLSEEERRRIPNDCIGAFVSESSQVAYPIIGQIVDFLEQNSLRLSHGRPFERVKTDAPSATIQQSVKQWYDEFGWQKNKAGTYNDTALFSQRSLTAHGAYELASHLSLLDRLPGGDFVLDAASGPIAHPEYLAYSWFYKYRVCVDLSLTALREAQEKLAGKGFAVMANICKLPFREGVFDGVISGYTIQHISESQQSDAVKELYRVLSPGSHLCVIGDLRWNRAHHLLVSVMRTIRKVSRLLSAGKAAPNWRQTEHQGIISKAPHELYFHARDIAWWRTQAQGLTHTFSIEGFRLFGKAEFGSLFGESRRAARTVRKLEALFPRLTAGMSAYLLVDLLKAHDR